MGRFKFREIVFKKRGQRDPLLRGAEGCVSPQVSPCYMDKSCRDTALGGLFNF